MTTRSIIEYVKNHPAGKVKIAYSDIDGILRGKYVATEKFLSGIDGGTAFCDVIFGWDSNDVAYDNATYTGWHTGYPDAPARLDLSTFRKIPWENDLPFFLGEFVDRKGNPSYACPRQLVKKVIQDARDLGFQPIFSQEFEWFNFEETPSSAQEKNYKNLTPLTPGMFGYSILRSTLQNPFFTDLFELLRKFDVPLEGLHTETGPGVLEAAIAHAHLLEAADRAVLFKTAVKEIAYKHGIMATFMAKISENLPGCGGHVHQSLWDKTGKKNLFDITARFLVQQKVSYFVVEHHRVELNERMVNVEHQAPDPARFQPGEIYSRYTPSDVVGNEPRGLTDFVGGINIHQFLVY